LLAFNSNRDGDFELFTMRTDGSQQTQRTADPGSDRKPVWSPDGTRVAFMSDRDGDFDIYATDIGGSNLVQVTNDPASDFNPS
jgi:Tol biopolymer transport system component